MVLGYECDCFDFRVMRKFEWDMIGMKMLRSQTKPVQ